MMPDANHEVPMTAEQLLRELERDPTHRKKIESRRRETGRKEEEYRRLLAPVRRDLAALGYVASDMSDLVKRYAPLPNAIVEVLLRWLMRIHNDRLIEMMARALCATAEPFDGRVLAQLWENTSDDAVKWAIATAITIGKVEGIPPQLRAEARGIVQ